MPRPVEALPCGSMSITRVGWPTAASAVPRLIAVVVLPTPPFWLATTRTRSFFGSACIAQLPDLEDRPRSVRKAWMFGDRHLPGFAGLGQFNLYRLTLQEQVCGRRALKTLCIGEQLGQRRAGPGGDSIERLRLETFHPRIADLDIGAGPRGDLFEEAALLGDRIGEHHPQLRPEQRQHHSGEAGAAAEIDQRL